MLKKLKKKWQVKFNNKLCLTRYLKYYHFYL